MDPASGDATLDSAIDALYAGSLAEFIPARNRLAKALRDRGDRAAADHIKRLGKPSLSAWAANQLWWHARAEMEELLAAAAVVRQLQQRGAGPTEQQRAARQRRACLDTLLREAQLRLIEGGHAAASTTMRKVSTTLEALAAHGEDVPAPGPGRLVDDLDPPGFDALGGALAAPRSSPAPAAPSDSGVIELTRPVDGALAARRRFAAQALENAERAAREAARALDSAAAAADDAAAAANAAEQAYRRARAEADAARRRAEHAEVSWRRDAKQADALAEATNTARERLREAEAEVAALRDALDELSAEG